MKRPLNHSQEDISEIIFRGLLPNNWIFRRKCKDYGIDIELEIVDEEHVTGKVLWIQLKSSRLLKKSETDIYYDCPMSLLRYANNCEIPVLLVLIDVNSKEGYCLFLQQYIHQNLVQDHCWNRKKIRVQFPILSSFTHIAQREYRDLIEFASLPSLKRSLLEFAEPLKKLQQMWRWAVSFIWEALEDDSSVKDLEEIILRFLEYLKNIYKLEPIHKELFSWQDISEASIGKIVGELNQEIVEFLNFLKRGEKDHYHYGFFGGRVGGLINNLGAHYTFLRNKALFSELP